MDLEDVINKKILDLIKNRILLCDGGMGTSLYNKGVYINSCFDELNLSLPDVVGEIHAAFIQSGSDIIETNTFGANRFKLKNFGLEDKLVEINKQGARIARKAGGENILVAGSMGPLGIKVEPWGRVPAEEAQEAFGEQAQALWDGGVDVFILETFSDINEIHQAIKAIKKMKEQPTVIAHMTVGQDGNSLHGTTPEVFTQKLEEWGADVIGINCSVGPDHLLRCIERMAKVTTRPLSAMPNAGMPRDVEGRNIYLCSPDYMGEYAKRFILSGVKIIGGCCGTTPDHIKAMQKSIRAVQPPMREQIHIPPPRDREAVEKIPMSDKSFFAGKIARYEFVCCVEIVPPRGHNAAKAVETAKMLEKKGIDCVNIPDGPRASARMSAMAIASLLRSQTRIEPLLHYTCRDRNLLGMQSDLLGIHAHGIRNVLLVTGDPPKMGDYPDATAVFDVDSVGLTNVVNSLNSGIDIGGKKLSDPTGYLIGVAANPGAINLDHEVSRFERKVDAGAEFAITQPVFDIRLLEKFLKRIAHCRIPFLAGIWPLLSLRNAEFMHNEVPGASVPEDVMSRMRKAQEKGAEFAREEGVAIAREVLGKIKNEVEGVQISPPLGQYGLVLKVLEALSS